MRLANSNNISMKFEISILLQIILLNEIPMYMQIVIPSVKLYEKWI